MDDIGQHQLVSDQRQCTQCGAPLAATDTQPLCSGCVFRRLADTGSTLHPLETTASEGGPDKHDTDFYSEYELLGEIGRGGMGVIYKAHQASLNRIVALKVIHAANQAGEAARRRFESEMQMAGRLNHPNIVPVFDTGEMDGCPCFSMEYFSGGTLAAHMREFAAKPENGVRLLVRVARAVSFAHQRGVLHRDLKPANILLDDVGEPHVADFGLAKQLDSDSDVTRAGAVLGSPNYMSPEQAAGKSESLTVATDIYSLGVILYEMLTGRTPFVADTPLETMRLVVEKEAQRPSTIVAKVNRDLETICLKCLRKEPEQRYRTAEELADDLERWLRHEPIQARPVAGIERFQKWVRRHPALATMSAMFLVAILAGVIGVLWQWRQAEEARRRETQQLRRAEAALARSSLSLAEAALREGNGPAALAALDTVPNEWRDSTWAYLHGESDTSRALPAPGAGEWDEIIPHPARPHVFVAVARSGIVTVFDARSGSQQLSFVPDFEVAAPGAILHAAISPDGARIVIGRSRTGGIVVHSLKDGRRLRNWDTPAAEKLEFSPDGSMLVQTVPPRTRIIMWEADAATKLWELGDGFNSVHFAAGSEQLTRYCWSGGLQLLSARDGSVLRSLQGSYLERHATHADAGLVVAANSLGYVHGFDLKDGRQRFVFQPHESPIQHLAFLPGGERFLTAATLPDGRQALQCWDSRAGRQCQILTGGSGNIRNLALHPLSGELIVVAREARVWETGSVPPWRVIRGGNAHPSAVFWGDDLVFAPGRNGASADLQQITADAAHVLWRAESPDHGQPSVSADGRHAAIGRYDSGHSLAVLERDGQDVKQVSTVHHGLIFGYARMSQDGSRVAVVSADRSTFRVHDAETGRRSGQFDTENMKRFSDLAWLDGAQRLAGLVTAHAPRNTPGSVELIVLWDVASGRRIAVATNATVTSVACQEPGGRRFAEAGADRNVRIRDGASLAVLREFRTHNAPITALAWHPRLPVLATASEDLAIRLWNVETGERLEELRGPLSPPSVLSFSPGGTRLATASRDRAARIWEPRSLAPQTTQK